MSDRRNEPYGQQGCHAQGRRRPDRGENERTRRRQPRDVCPQRRRLPNPDHEAFVDWFVLYWRQRGAQLSDGQLTDESEV
jgi:hypothetical protein